MTSRMTSAGYSLIIAGMCIAAINFAVGPLFTIAWIRVAAFLSEGRYVLYSPAQLRFVVASYLAAPVCVVAGVMLLVISKKRR